MAQKRGLGVVRGFRPVIVAAIAVFSLGACSALPEGSSPLSLLQPAESGDAALASLARTDYHEAEKHAREALGEDATDPYALFAAAVANERLGRRDAARQYYRILAAVETDARTPLRPSGGEERLVDVARSALDRLEGRSEEAGATTETRNPPPKPVAAQRPEVTVSGALEEEVTDARPAPRIDGISPNVVRRFLGLERLLDEELITPEEFRTRRQANLGALLPWSQPPPAPGLARAVPEPDAVIERLHDLREAHEAGALSARAHAVERRAILDGLLPAHGGQGTRPPPPRDMLAAAAALGRIERLYDAGLVNRDEADSERKALHAAMAALQDPAESRTAMADNRDAGAPFPLIRPQGRGATESPPPAASASAAAEAPAAGEPAMAVHLASYRDRAALARGWKQLQKRFPDRLGGLDMVVSRVDLGPEKGVFYRLKAGPLPGDAAAKDLCRSLKRQGQYCQPAFFSS